MGLKDRVSKAEDVALSALIRQYKDGIVLGGTHALRSDSYNFVLFELKISVSEKDKTEKLAERNPRYYPSPVMALDAYIRESVRPCTTAQSLLHALNHAEDSIAAGIRSALEGVANSKPAHATIDTESTDADA